MSPCSTASGVEPVASCSRLAMRKTCVSTAMAGWWKATLMTTLAVLRPTPGSLWSASKSSGTSPPNSVQSIWQVARMFFALLRKSPQSRISFSSAGSPIATMSSGDLTLAKRRFVVTLTRLSVHCAERMTAIRSSNGLRKMSSGFAPRYVSSRMASCSSRIFFVTRIKSTSCSAKMAKGRAQSMN